MKCSGSQTTCIAADPLRAHEVAARFEAVLFAAALAPLAKSLGFFGDVALDQVSLTVARHDHTLSATFERLFER